MEEMNNVNEIVTEGIEESTDIITETAQNPNVLKKVIGALGVAGVTAGLIFGTYKIIKSVKNRKKKDTDNVEIVEDVK